MNEYKGIFEGLINRLRQLNSSDTKGVTESIKSFFAEKYSDFHVAGVNGRKEFLFDICALPCDPIDVCKNIKSDYKIHLAVESELGGESASSPDYVERNTIEDFFKLLCASSKEKVMISAYSIPAGHDTQEALNLKVQKFSSINNKSSNEEEILCIFLQGNHTSGGSRQIKLVYPFVANGFVLRKNSEPFEITGS